VGSKRKIFYACGYSMVSTVPCWRGFCVEMGEWGLENQYLIIFWDGREASPYVRAQEGSTGGQRCCHGGGVTGDFLWVFHIECSTRVIF